MPEVKGEVIGSEGESDTITSRPTSLDYAIASGSGTEILALLKSTELSLVKRLSH